MKMAMSRNRNPTRVCCSTAWPPQRVVEKSSADVTSINSRTWDQSTSLQAVVGLWTWLPKELPRHGLAPPLALELVLDGCVAVEVHIQAAFWAAAATTRRVWPWIDLPCWRERLQLLACLHCHPAQDRQDNYEAMNSVIHAATISLPACR